MVITEIVFRERDKKGRRRYSHEYKPPRLYVHPKGETVMDNFVAGRHTRPYTEWKKNVVPAVLAWIGLPSDLKVRWSQSAGCTMCPCSPGFILPEGSFEHDIFVTVEYPKGGYSDQVAEVTAAVRAGKI